MRSENKRSNKVDVNVYCYLSVIFVRMDLQLYFDLKSIVFKSNTIYFLLQSTKYATFVRKSYI